jgi:hypothetical protein
MGKDLRRCLEVIHNDIVEIWNFPQLAMVRRHELSPVFESHFFFFQLRRDNFRGKISKLVDDLADQSPSPNSNM